MNPLIMNRDLYLYFLLKAVNRPIKVLNIFADNVCGKFLRICFADKILRIQLFSSTTKRKKQI